MKSLTAYRSLIVCLTLSVFFLGPVPAPADEPRTLKEVDAEIIRLSEEMGDGNIDLETFAQRSSELLELRSRIMAGELDAETSQAKSPNQVEVGATAPPSATPQAANALAWIGPVAPSAGDTAVFGGVPAEFSGRVLAEQGGERIIAASAPGAGQGDQTGPLRRWQVVLPYEMPGDVSIRFEGLEHPPILIRVAPPSLPAGTLDGRLGALSARLRQDLVGLGWPPAKALKTLLAAPASLPEAARKPAMLLFAFEGTENPLTIRTLIEIEIEAAEDPKALEARLADRFDRLVGIPSERMARFAGRHEIRRAILHRERLGAVQPANSGSVGSAEELFALMARGDQIATAQGGLDLGAQAASGGGTALGVVAGHPGVLLTEILFSTAGEYLRQTLHEYPRHLDIQADFIKGENRAINASDCLKLVVKVSARSEPLVDVLFSQGSKGFELMAKLTVALAEGYLGKRGASLGDALGPLGSRIRNAERFGRDPLAAEDAIRVVNTALSWLASEAESGSETFQLRVVPARHWGPFTLTTEQVARYVTVQTHRGPVKINPNTGCIRACWPGREDPFSVSVSLATAPEIHGYRRTSTLARGYFAKPRVRFFSEPSTLEPGQSARVGWEIEGVESDSVTLSIEGHRGGRHGSASGGFGIQAPEKIDGCRDSMTLEAKLDGAYLCADAPSYTASLEIQDPSDQLNAPAALRCRGKATIPFSVSGSGGEALCSLRGAGALSGSGMDFSYTCSGDEKPSSIICRVPGASDDTCAQVIQVEYAEPPGIGFAGSIVAAVDRRRIPSFFTEKQLFLPRLPVLGASDLAEESWADGLTDPAGRDEMNDPAAIRPMTGDYFESFAEVHRAAESFTYSRSDQESDPYGSETIRTQITVSVSHDDPPSLRIDATIQGEQKAFENRGAKKVRTRTVSELTFLGYIPIDKGGPAITASVLIDASILGRNGHLSVLPYTEDEEENLTLVMQAWRLVAAGAPNVSNFGGWSPLGAAKRGSAREMIELDFPATTKERGVLLTIDGHGQAEVLNRIDGVRMSPIRIGEGTEIMEMTDLRIQADIELISVERRP